MTEDLKDAEWEFYRTHYAQIKKLGYTMGIAYCLKDRIWDIWISPINEGGTIDDAVLDQIKDLFPEELEANVGSKMIRAPLRVVYYPERFIPL